MKAPSRNRQARYAAGMAAEYLAALWLALKGYKILAMRFKVPQGEIDIVAVKRRTLVMVEVKWRASSTDDALYAVTPHSQRRIALAAQAFLMRHPAYADYDIRFDVLALSWAGGMRHLDNAWRPGS